MLEILREVGLTANGARVYQCLLQRGELNVAGISKHARIHRRNVYDAVARLVEQGLVYEISGDERVYEAVTPEKLMDLLKERETKLQEKLPTLMREFGRRPKEEEVYIYRGVEGVKNFLRDVLAVGNDLYIVGAKGFWFDNRVSAFTENFLREARRKRLEIFTIYDEAMFDTLADVPTRAGGDYRVLPRQYGSDVSLNIFGDRIATFAGDAVGDLGADLTLVVTVSRQIADGYRKWFDFLWDHCPRRQPPKP